MNTIKYNNMASLCWILNASRPRRNEQHFPDDIFKRIFFNENVWIAIKISLKFVPMGPINNIPALVQIMAWRRSGDKSLSEVCECIYATNECPHLWTLQFWKKHGGKFYNGLKKGEYTMESNYKPRIWVVPPPPHLANPPTPHRHPHRHPRHPPRM